MSNKKRKIEQKIWTLHIFTEGSTEQHYIGDWFNSSYFPNLRKRIENIKGGGYQNFINKLNSIERNIAQNTVVIIITDLDRANQDPTEKEKLKNLINKLEKQSNNNMIFLTFINFETFLNAILPDGKTVESLHIKKSDKDIYQKIQGAGGKLSNMPSRLYYEDTLFYKKDTPGIQGKIEENNIDKEQSNLYSFEKYLQELNDMC